MNNIEKREVYWQIYFCLVSDVELELKSFLRMGLCSYLYNLRYIDDMSQLLTFPELYAQRPVYMCVFWWNRLDDGYEKRKQAVLRAIELTYA